MLRYLPGFQGSRVSLYQFLARAGVVDDTDCGATKAMKQYNLHRFIVPPNIINSHDPAFSGYVMSISTALCPQTQALWITAYFNKQVLVSADVPYKTMLHIGYVEWRYPAGFGDCFPDLTFDTLLYLNYLLRDPDLEKHRINRTIANIFPPADQETIRV